MLKMAGWVVMNVYEAIKDVPMYHYVLEIGLLLCALWLIFHKNQSAPAEVSKEELDQFINNFEPEPLVPETPQDHNALHNHIVSGKAQKYIKVGQHDCLNLATHNYLGFVGNEYIEEHALKAIKKYGVGSCGPRGFYGTVDVHLELEERLAQFMQMEEAVVYSYGFSTVASAIPAYAKRSDIIFADERVNFAIQKGLDASRSKIKYFHHNDCEHLEKLLIEQKELDLKNLRKASNSRRFLIVEGIYMNTGEICPLPRLIELSKQFCARIFVDESISFGTLGSNGRGVTEYYNVPRDDVDLIMGSMECSMASIGGFCVGSSFIVEHQRLSGLGYCFSASLPPLLTIAAIKALDVMEQIPSLFANLNQCCSMMHKTLAGLQGLTIKGHPDSPVKYLTTDKGFVYSVPEESVLPRIVEYCLEHGIAMTIPTYLEDVEVFPVTKAIRITVNNTLTKEEIESAVSIIQQAVGTVMDNVTQ